MKIRTQKVVIERTGEDLFVMFNDGSIQVVATPEQASNVVAQAAKRGNKGITVTSIEWRNMPEGFVPPAGEVR